MGKTTKTQKLLRRADALRKIQQERSQKLDRELRGKGKDGKSLAGKIADQKYLQKLKKVQSQIQNDAVRVSAPNRDDLQLVMAALRTEDWGMQLNYGNYR